MLDRPYPGHKDYELHRSLGLPVCDVPPYVSPLSVDEKRGLGDEMVQLRLRMLEILEQFPILQPQVQALKITGKDLSRGNDRKNNAINALSKQIFTAHDGTQSDEELSVGGYVSRKKLSEAIEELKTLSTELCWKFEEKTGVSFRDDGWYA